MEEYKTGSLYKLQYFSSAFQVYSFNLSLMTVFWNLLESSVRNRDLKMYSASKTSHTSSFIIQLSYSWILACRTSDFCCLGQEAKKSNVLLNQIFKETLRLIFKTHTNYRKEKQSTIQWVISLLKVLCKVTERQTAKLMPSWLWNLAYRPSYF